MTFQKVGFEQALSQNKLYIEKDGSLLDPQTLASMTVADLEQGSSITLFGDLLRLFRSDYDYLFWCPLNENEREDLINHPEGIGYYWRGCSTGPPILPREPCLPESNALKFFHELYETTLNGMDDNGKIVLD
jgi:hypothetical protein